MKYQRPALGILEHQGRIFEVLNHRQFALDTRIRDATHFFRIKLLPFLIVELFIKCRDALRVDKIDKRVSHIAAILKVYGKVKEVVGTLMMLIDS